MATKGKIQANINKEAMVKKFANRRRSLKAIIMNKETLPEDRFAAQLKLTKLPKNSNPTRVRNRCMITGRPRGFYGKFRLSRIALRSMAAFGVLPGVKKSSW